MTDEERVFTMTVAKAVGFDIEAMELTPEQADYLTTTLFKGFDAYTARGADYGSAMLRAIDEVMKAIERGLS